MSKARKPKYVIVEGGDAVGKTTALEGLKSELSHLTFVQEPSDDIRREVEAVDDGGEKEILDAFVRGRLATLEGQLLPSLSAGKTVVSDRGFPSSMIYQGAIGGLGTNAVFGLHNEFIESVEAVADLIVVVFTAEESVVQSRTEGRIVAADRFESAPDDTKRAIRDAYRGLVVEGPAFSDSVKWTELDTSQLTLAEVRQQLRNIVLA